MTKEEKKDEMKNRISMALKDPILQQGFEIICKENAELKAQIENMKCCENCKHFNNVEDLEYCQNCERQLVNSLDKLPREEIIKDEWELKEIEK